MNLSSSDLERFWAKVSTASDEECWLWTAAVDTGGYGQFRVGGKNIKAHRISWIIKNGSNPDDHILHSCDNPSCVNPKHLRIGTHTENIRDMYDRERSRHTLYAKQQVVDMRRKALSGATRQDLVDEFGGTRHSVSAAVSGKTYAWVDEPVVHHVSKDRFRGSKLTTEQVLEIKRLLLKPYHGLNKKICKIYGLSPAEVSHIKYGRLYADVSLD